MSDKWSPEAIELAKTIAQHIEEQRLVARETVDVYAARLNISPATYNRLKSGNPGIAVGALFEWAILAGKSDELANAFRIDNLFDLPTNRQGRVAKRIRK